MWELMTVPHEDFVEKVGRDMYDDYKESTLEWSKISFPKVAYFLKWLDTLWEHISFIFQHMS